MRGAVPEEWGQYCEPSCRAGHEKVSAQGSVVYQLYKRHNHGRMSPGTIDSAAEGKYGQYADDAAYFDYDDDQLLVYDFT